MQEYIAFSDGSPVLELEIFFVVLLFSAMLMHWTPAKVLIGKISVWVVDLVRRREALPLGTIQFEMFKLDAARIIVGGIAFWRYSSILASSLQGGSTLSIALAAGATAAAACVAVGLFTRVATLLLMASANTVVDNYLGASTLGTMVMSMVMLIFVIAPAGRTMSLDSLIHGRRETDFESIVLGKMAGLLAYYCVCLYSIFWHLHDEAWTSLNVIGWVLLSPDANPNYSHIAWSIYEWSPWVFVNFVRLSILGMFAWYALVLPGLFLGKIPRSFVVFWGLTFFLISTFVLPLSYLGWYELVLWAILFVPPMRRPARPAPQPTGNIGAVQGGLLITLVVLAASFVARLPVMNVEPDQSAPGSWSKQLFGSAPAALGIHKINVFNRQDLSVFSFRGKNYFYSGELDLTSLPYSLLSPAPINWSEHSDTIVYGMVRQARRASRENIGCDREHFLAIMPYLKAMYRGVQPQFGKIISTIWVLRQPTAEDFAAYHFAGQAEYPLCTALIDLTSGQINDLVFLQSGVDEKLRQLGYPAVVDSKHLEGILGYQCANDGRFLWALSTNRLESQDGSLIDRIRSVTGDIFGRFQLDCLMEVREITERWPQLLSQPFEPSPATCEAGVNLLTSLQQEVGDSLEVDLVADIAKATAARDAGDLSGCIAASLAGRDVYWNAVIRRTSLPR